MAGEEPAWVRIQKKTFTRWCNNYLTQRSLSINDLQADLADGTLLHNLLEILGNEDVLPKTNKKAKLKLQKVENLNTCLRYIKSKNINLVNIGAEDLHDGKIKLILGLIWTLILRFQIMAEDEESAGARAALLAWCNSVLNPQGLYVKNFTGDWQDGRCFCGLVNAIEPNQIPLNTVPASEAEKNMNRAFQDAEKLFGFPQVLDAIDVIENVDDLSVMTYVSYFRAYMLANNAFGPNCTAEGPGLTEATTFEKAPFTITTYNEEGERVERGGAMVKATLKDDSGAEVTKVNLTDNRNGTYSAYYVAERPGKFTLEILVKKDNIKNSPFHPTVKPGEPFPGNCEAHGPGISAATAGVEVGFTVVTKDVSGNAIPRGGANISAVLHDGKGDIKVNIKDNGDGTYAATYTPKTAGSSRLDVTVATQHNGTGPIKNSPFNVAVAPGKVDLNNFKWDGLELDAQGRRVVVAGTTDHFSVTAHDGNGNRLASGGLGVNGQISGGPAEVKVATKDNNDGSYKLEYTPTKIGQYQFLVRVDSAPIGGHTNPFPLLVIPAGAKGSNSIASGPGLKNAEVGGNNNKFSVETRDAFDNKLTQGGAKVAADLVNDATGEKTPVSVKDNGNGTYDAEYAGITKAGKYTLTPTVNGEAVKDAPFKVDVTHGKVDPKNFKWDGLSLDAQGRRVVVAGTTDHFSVTAHDSHGNRITSGGLNVNGKVSGPADVKVATKDNNDGSYKLEYTPVKTGQYQFQVNLDSTAIGGHTNPFPVLVVPAGAGARSVASGPGLKNAEVGGKNNKFTVETRDDFDNKLTQGGNDVKAELVNDATGEKVPVAIKDNGDGTYSAEYAPSKAGNYTLTPTVNGKVIVDAPFKIKANPGGFDPNNTDVEIPKPGHAGRRGPKVSVKDNQGNLRAGFDDDVEADLTPKIKIPKIKARSNGDGTYEIDYPPNLLPGDYEIDIRVNGHNAPKSPFIGPVALKELTPEHKGALNQLVPKDAALFERLLLNATDKERDAVLAALKK